MDELEIIDTKKIRHIYDEKTKKWYFSVVDVVAVLMEKDYQTARKYWKVLKGRLVKEGADEVVTNCYQLKMLAPDGKMRETDAADAETMLRIVQSVPSPKAEPIKLWLAQTGYERIQETADPEMAVNRAREYWQRMGHSDKWIKARLSGQDTRGKLTDYWGNHGVKEGEEYAILTNLIHQTWSGVSVQQHKKLKGLKNQNLRDHMSEAELIFTALAELTTRQIAEANDANGMKENAVAAKRGGKVARNAKDDYEQETGQKVITSENYLKKPKELDKFGNSE